MNLPNKLTVARFLLTAVFVVLFYIPYANHFSIALLVFLVASLTDYLDGEIARRKNLITNFGKLMDPLADKVLMGAALVLLAVEDQTSLHDPHIPAWAVVVVMTREFFVTGIRLLAASHGAVLAAEKLGKHKTVWQMVAAFYFLGWHASIEPLGQWLAPLYATSLFIPQVFGRIAIGMMVLLTVVSGFSYFWKNRSLFAEA